MPMPDYFFFITIFLRFDVTGSHRHICAQRDARELPRLMLPPRPRLPHLPSPPPRCRHAIAAAAALRASAVVCRRRWLTRCRCLSAVARDSAATIKHTNARADAQRASARAMPYSR
jgi:hypothetical protein